MKESKKYIKTKVDLNLQNYKMFEYCLYFSVSTTQKTFDKE